MKTYTRVQSYNTFIILFFLAAVIVELFAIPFVDNPSYSMSTGPALFYILLLVFLKWRNFNPATMRWLILLGGSAYVLLLNMIEPSFSHLLYFIFPPLFSFVYKHWPLIISVAAATSASVLSLFFLNGSDMIKITESHLLVHFVLLFVMLILATAFLIQKVSVEIERLHEENSLKDIKLSSKEGYLTSLFEHSHDAIAVFSLDAKVITMNPAFEKLYGWKENECTGKAVQFHPDSHYMQVVERNERIKNGESLHFRTKEMMKDGTLFDAEMTLAPIYSETGDIIASSIIVRNVEKKIEAERLKLDMIRLNAFGEMAANVAHEVRNPMTSISGFIQMMNEDPANPYRPFTEIMEGEAKRINLIASEFLVLAKPNIKEMADIDVESAVLDVLVMFEEEFKGRNIDCHVFLAEHQSFIHGNIDSIKQVYINCLRNSLDNMPDGGKIDIINQLEAGQFSSRIKDSGNGMEHDTLSHLFDPFFTTKQEAAGLGMTISKKIIYDHHGTIEVTSKIGEGTETRIQLPLSSIKQETVPLDPSHRVFV